MPQYKVTVIGGESSVECCCQPPVAKQLSHEEVEAHLKTMGTQGWTLNFVQMFPGSGTVGSSYYYIWEK